MASEVAPVDRAEWCGSIQQRERAAVTPCHCPSSTRARTLSLQRGIGRFTHRPRAMISPGALCAENFVRLTRAAIGIEPGRDLVLELSARACRPRPSRAATGRP